MTHANAPLRRPARPHAGTLLRAATAALALAAAGAFAQDKPSPVKSFDTVQNDKGYVATVVMYAPVPPALAWEVLTDFDSFAKFVPNVKESKIASRDGNTLMVEQKGVAKFGLLSFPYASVRRMQLEPQTSILSTQVQGSMKRQVSLMKLFPEGSGTRLEYKLEIEPSGIAATVMSKEFLQHEITDQFTAIVGEMARRAK